VPSSAPLKVPLKRGFFCSVSLRIVQDAQIAGVRAGVCGPSCRTVDVLGELPMRSYGPLHGRMGDPGRRDAGMVERLAEALGPAARIQIDGDARFLIRPEWQEASDAHEVEALGHALLKARERPDEDRGRVRGAAPLRWRRLSRRRRRAQVLRPSHGRDEADCQRADEGDPSRRDARGRRREPILCASGCEKLRATRTSETR
jgi:hypothetical protein